MGSHISTTSDGRRLVSIMLAADLVGVARRTIYNWIAAGKVECIRTAGGSIRIYEDTLFQPLGKAPKSNYESSRGIEA